MPGTPRVLIHVWCISHGFLKRGRRSRDTEWWQRLAAEKARDKDGVGPVRSLFYNSEGTAASSCHVTHRAQQEGPGLASPCPAGVCPPPVPPSTTIKDAFRVGAMESITLAARQAVGCEDLHAGAVLSGAGGPQVEPQREEQALRVGGCARRRLWVGRR